MRGAQRQHRPVYPTLRRLHTCDSHECMTKVLSHKYERPRQTIFLVFVPSDLLVLKFAPQRDSDQLANGGQLRHNPFEYVDGGVCAGIRGRLLVHHCHVHQYNASHGQWSGLNLTSTRTLSCTAPRTFAGCNGRTNRFRSFSIISLTKTANSP